MMDSYHNNPKPVDEDRLSSLPDELIHKILSSFDMKLVVQMCLLSLRWKLIWTSVPCLNFSSDHFDTSLKFTKFVTNVLSHRNHQTEVSSIKLHYDVPGLRRVSFLENYQQLPPCLFSSQSLKHFTLTNLSLYWSACVTPKTPWNLPALTTLYLSAITLCDATTRDSVDLFSKCVNLKNLTLKSFIVEAVKVFDIITPRLSNLMLIDGRCSRVINVIAPTLENLTIVNCSIKYLNAPPGLSSFCYMGYPPLQLSKDQFHSLIEVTICLYLYRFPYTEEDACLTINMLRELHSARYLTLNEHIVEGISSFPDLLSHLPSPFSNLMCLTIESSIMNDAHKVKLCTAARNFLLENSPSAMIQINYRRGRLCRSEAFSSRDYCKFL